MTLLELMIAMTIMVMVVGALGFLAKGVEQGFEYIESHDTVTQHARVAMQRIETAVREATANSEFPGILVVPKDIASWSFPDTLVVWNPAIAQDDPDAVAADPDGLPQFDELVIYCPDATDPNELVEITLPKDVRTVPVATDPTTWNAEIRAIKRSPRRETVVLTDLVRSCTVEGVAVPQQRGAVRFVSRQCPSQEEFDAYTAGKLAWEDLTWVQGQTEFCQAWVRIELQLVPGKEVQQVVPFLGSAALYYVHKKP